MTKQAHTDRAHATLAPSAAHRWMVCPGSIVLEQGFPNTTSVYAAEGTAAHELASWCLANDEQPEDHLGLWIDIKATDGNPFVDLSLDDDDTEREPNRYFEINDDMVMAVTVYTDFVGELCRQSDDYELSVEQRLDGTYLHPDIFGTGDMTGYSEKLRHLDVVDYKHGKGKNVAVEDNPQLFLYGALTAARFHNRPLETITLHIVQPRSGGKAVKSKKYDLFDIFEFEDVVKTAAGHVDDATEQLADKDASGAWESVFLTAGEHCGFCKAQATCPAARANAFEAAQAEFDDMDNEMSLPDFVKFNPDQLADTLAKADQLLAWIKAVQVHAHEQACANNMPTGYKLVAKRANRKWRSELEAKIALAEAGVKTDDMFEPPKMKGPAKIEKIMKKKPFETWLEKNTNDEGESPIVKISSGTNLVPVDDPRPAVKMDGSSEFGSADE
jgi:hypothetical protein